MLAIAVHNETQHQQTQFGEGNVRIGSMLDGASFANSENQSYLLILDPLVWPHQISLNQIPGETATIELTNHGRSLALNSGPRIHRGRTTLLELPVSFCVGDTEIQIFDTDAEHPLNFALAHLSDKVANPGDQQARLSPGPETLAAWLDTLSDLQRSVAGSQSLFDVAARAVFNPGGLDGGMVLVQSEEGWEIAASHIPYAVNGIGFRDDLIRRAVESKKTVYHDATLVDANPTIDDFHTAVVCPVFDAAEEVVSVVYGFRSLHGPNSRRGIRILEAQFVQVVADALSAGMIRLESEAEAARSKVLLEQVFSPKIAKQLQSSPGFLESKECEVSVLFADLRRFSTISEKIGNHETFELLADVMDQFSRIITDLDGVIIDFYGDGVSAFWNAPIKQPDHAILACRAGLNIIESLDELNQTWASRLGEPIRVGVGVHTGLAQVGNSGSRSRIKYGPRGNTVNLASRLENATKQVGVPMLISGATAKKVEGVFSLRRIINTSLTGIKATTSLFQIAFRDRREADLERFEQYEEALNLFESSRLEEAIDKLNQLKLDSPDDPVLDYLLNETNSKIHVANG